MLLDISAPARGLLRSRFPNILAQCLRFGIDITSEPIPVVPAAHYMCGGVTSDLHGRTTPAGPLGDRRGRVHRATRRQPPGVEFAARGAGVRRVARRKSSRTLIAELRSTPLPDMPEWQTGSAVPSDEAVVVTHNWDEIRRLMWNYVGIVRTSARLRRAARRVALLEEEIREYYWKHLVTRDLLELRNIQTVAELIISPPPAGTRAAACITRSTIPKRSRLGGGHCHQARRDAAPARAMSQGAACSRRCARLGRSARSGF